MNEQITSFCDFACSLHKKQAVATMHHYAMFFNSKNKKTLGQNGHCRLWN